MKRRVALVLGLIGLSLVCASLVQAKTARIGIVYDGYSQRFAAAKDLFITEIRSMTRGAHKVSFPEEAQLSGDWDVGRINRALDRLLASKKVDMILTLGEVAEREPIIRSYLTEAIGYAGAGIKAPKEKSDIDLPDELIAAFDSDPELAEAFHTLTPGRQKSYVINLNSAKTAATRTTRIAKFRAHILSGKGATER